MIDAKILNEFTRKLADALPPGLGELPRHVELNLRDLLEATLARMDLVPRKEFDVQSAVLARSREKLEALERRVAELEAALAEDKR